jgi:O-antigen/teichoic acid export membrane protein
MVWYAIPLLIAGMAGMVNETMDRILLTYLLPENEAMSQAGIYGACYKIAIIMTVFIQTFRFAAEPFFFSHSKEKDAKQTYADIMKYFVIVCSLIFLGTMMNLSWIQYFIGAPFRVGLEVVPILLLANLCLGVFINQSFWYKLTGQTRYGAYLAIIGAIITLVLNFYWIPRIGYMGSAWATLVCYATMMVLSYFLGQKHYPVNYDLKRIGGYVTLSLILYVLSVYIGFESKSMDLIFKNTIFLAFALVIFIFERKNFAANIK